LVVTVRQPLKYLSLMIKLLGKGGLVMSDKVRDACRFCRPCDHFDAYHGFDCTLIAGNSERCCEFGACTKARISGKPVNLMTSTYATVEMCDGNVTDISRRGPDFIGRMAQIEVMPPR